MAIRQRKPMGFVDVMLEGGPWTAALLERLEAATPWRELAAPIYLLPEYTNPGPGRPALDPTLMVKCLLLAKWYNLSDPQLEEQLRDRISFRRFVGLSFADSTPDETSFMRFRDRLHEAGLHEVIFDAVVKHIGAQGPLIREGTLVDATIFEAPRGWLRDDGTSTRDPDASSTSKHGVPHHGYKGHLAVDLSKIVTDYRFGTAKEHDSRHIEDLTMHEEKSVIADSAYSKEERREELRSRGVIDAICYKRVRGQAELYAWQARWNTRVSRLRARVEHALGMLK